jgi:hypothetical protein
MQIPFNSSNPPSKKSSELFGLNDVLDEVNDIAEFERRAEQLRDRLHSDNTALSEQEMLLLKNIFCSNSQFIDKTVANRQLVLLALASLLEPLIENTSYSPTISSIVRTLLKSQEKPLRYAALDIIAAGLGIVPVANRLLEEAKTILKNEEPGYVFDYLDSLIGRSLF